MVVAREGRLANAWRMSKYSYQETDTTDVGVFESRKVCEGIDPGNSYGERPGSRIFLQFLQLQMVVSNPNISETDCGFIRCLVLNNKFINSTYTVELFEGVGETRTPVNYDNGGNVAQLLSNINVHKFDVVWDKRYAVKAQITGDDKPHTLLIKVNIPIKRYFSFTTNATADLAILPDMDFCFFFEKQDGGAALTSSLNYSYTLIHHYYSLD
jgi:hypothetical protein|uniref:hypothetical protein n=1 Tax=Pseudomonadati TaxID=3379134 RepID=UPI004047CA1A